MSGVTISGPYDPADPPTAGIQLNPTLASMTSTKLLPRSLAAFEAVQSRILSAVQAIDLCGYPVIDGAQDIGRRSGTDLSAEVGDLRSPDTLFCGRAQPRLRALRIPLALPRPLRWLCLRWR